MQRRAEQPSDEWIDGAVQDREAGMSGGHLPRLSPSACFGALLDPEQHPPFHQEVRDLYEHPVCHRGSATGDAAPGDQAGSITPKRLEGKRCPPLEPERTPGLEHAHPQPARRM